MFLFLFLFNPNPIARPRAKQKATTRGIATANASSVESKGVFTVISSLGIIAGVGDSLGNGVVVD